MNIDERVYGHEPAASQLLQLRKQNEALRDRCRQLIAEKISLLKEIGQMKRGLPDTRPAGI